jgi:hypothetical protein
MIFDRDTYLCLKEVVRLIGEGQSWDALEVLRRNVDNDDLKYAISVAQIEAKKPW